MQRVLPVQTGLYRYDEWVVQDINDENQRWSRGRKAPGQGQGHKKNLRPTQRQPFRGPTSRGPGQECSRPRPRTMDTNASVLQNKNKKRSSKFFSGDLKKKEKKDLQNFFQAISTKNGLEKNFSIDLQNFNHSKIVLFSIRVQGNFWGLEALRPRPRTSKCVLENFFEAKDVLEDSTSDKNLNGS